jgi:hypothetical protein
MSHIPGMQTWIVLALAAAAALYLLRGALKAGSEGGCATGCGSCRKACSARTLAARLEEKD